jgi:hypothetical protein
VGSSGRLAWADAWATPGPVSLLAEPGAGRLAGSPAELAALDTALARLGERTAIGADPRLTTFRTLFAPTAGRLLRALASGIEPGDLLAALLRIF